MQSQGCSQQISLILIVSAFVTSESQILHGPGAGGGGRGQEGRVRTELKGHRQHFSVLQYVPWWNRGCVILPAQHFLTCF